MADVRIHRTDPYPEVLGEFLGSAVFGQQTEYVLLAHRERLADATLAGRLVKRRHHPVRNGAGHRRAPALELDHGFEDLLRPGMFDQVGGAAGLQGFEHPVDVFLDCEHDDLRARQESPQPGDTLDAGCAGLWCVELSC